MVCEDFREELEAFALDALSPDSQRRIEKHLRGCTGCSEIVRAYRTAVDYLALSVPLFKAPPRLKDRVLGGAGASRPLQVTRVIAANKWVMATAASVVLAVAISAIIWAMSLSARVESLKLDNAQLAELSQLDSAQRSALLNLQAQLASARNDQQRMDSTLKEQATLLVIALDPDLIPTELSGTDIAPAARCSYVWSSAQSLGALTCKNLPTVPFGFTYELWATRGEQNVAAGSFVSRSDGGAQLLVKFSQVEEPVTDLWITVEPATNLPRVRPSQEVILRKAPLQQVNR